MCPLCCCEEPSTQAVAPTVSGIAHLEPWSRDPKAPPGCESCLSTSPPFLPLTSLSADSAGGRDLHRLNRDISGIGE